MAEHKMRDNTGEWFGSIPADWTILALKYAFSIKKDIAGKLGYTVLSVTQKGIKPKDMLEKGQFAMDYSKYQVVNRGEFIMNHMDLLTGWVDIAQESGVTSPDYRVFYNTDPTRFFSEYYKYIFQFCYSNRVFYGMGQGVAGFGRWRLPSDMFLRFLLPVPQIDEQKAIATYLDEQCTLIDEAIAEAKVSIEEYKGWKASIIFEVITKGVDKNAALKESGISWIGQIPSTWNMCLIKYCTVKIGSGKTPSGGAEVYSDSGVMFLHSKNIYKEGLKHKDISNISKKIDKKKKNTRVQYRDVLLNITGGSIGRCCIFDLKDTPANVNQHVCILRTDPTKLLPEFLRYFWNSACGPIVIEQYQTGGNRAGLNFEQIGNIKIPFCSLAEQSSMVRHLDDVCEVIDDLVETKEKLISELESYKRSLIYEVVTGKRKVVQ